MVGEVKEYLAIAANTIMVYHRIAKVIIKFTTDERWLTTSMEDKTRVTYDTKELRVLALQKMFLHKIKNWKLL